MKIKPLKMDLTEGSETSAKLNLTPGENPKENTLVPDIFLRGKGGRCVGLTTLPLSCVDCLKVWEPQPAGTFRACQGL
jgi:hypothetical protein